MDSLPIEQGLYQMYHNQNSPVINPDAIYDFDYVRQRAFWRGLAYRLTARNNRLLNFNDYYEQLTNKSRRTFYNQLVPVQQIVGTVNRQHDFDAAFNPLREATANRWQRIRDAFMKDQILPPVELHKIGDLYFVEDGHHRISVARFSGQETIEANVIEYGD
jgi:hypothetical protein